MTRKLSRRNLLAMGAGAAASVLLAACAAPAATPTTAPTAAPKAAEPTKPAAQATTAPQPTTAAAKPTTASTPAAQPAAKSAGPAKLTFWTQDWNPPVKEVFTTKFFPGLKDKLQIEITDAQFLPWADYMQKELTSFAAGTMADVFEPALEEASDLALKNRAIPLDPYTKSATNVKIEDYFEGGWKVYQVKGQLYALPHRIDVRGNPYRKSILAEAGAKPPTTWDEFKDAATKLVVRKDNKLERAGTQAWPTGPAHQVMHTLWQAGGELFTPDGKQAAFDSAEGLAALKYMIDLFHITYPQGAAQLETSQVPHFITGKNPLLYGGGAGVRAQALQNKPELLSDIGSGVALKGPKAQVALIFGGGLSISTQSKNPDAAWQVIDFIHASDNLATWIDNLGSVPPRKSAEEWEWVKKDPGVVKGFLDIALNNGRSSPVFPEWGNLFDVQSNEFNKAFFGEQTPEQALKNAKTKWDEILKKYYAKIDAAR